MNYCSSEMKIDQLSIEICIARRRQKAVTRAWREYQSFSGSQLSTAAAGKVPLYNISPVFSPLPYSVLPLLIDANRLKSAAETDLFTSLAGRIADASTFSVLPFLSLFFTSLPCPQLCIL